MSGEPGMYRCKRCGHSTESERVFRDHASLRHNTDAEEIISPISTRGLSGDENDATGGLYGKYTVKKDGEPQAGCFVLKPESDPAARRALVEYADATDDDTLASDLRNWIAECEGDE